MPSCYFTPDLYCVCFIYSTTWVPFRPEAGPTTRRECVCVCEPSHCPPSALNQRAFGPERLGPEGEGRGGMEPKSLGRPLTGERTRNIKREKEGMEQPAGNPRRRPPTAGLLGTTWQEEGGGEIGGGAGRGLWDGNGSENSVVRKLCPDEREQSGRRALPNQRPPETSLL